MLKNYRTLGAVLALGEFTVDDLVALSGVHRSTVYTTLLRSRDKGYVERIGTEPSGRRGGQPGRWRLRPEAREHLRSELRELEQMGVGPWLAEEGAVTPGTLPGGLIAAEDILLWRAPTAANPAERAGLVKLAQAHLEAAQRTAASTTDHAARQREDNHRRLIQLLIDLESSEHTRADVASAQVADLLLTVGKIDEEPLTYAVKQRFHETALIPKNLGAPPQTPPPRCSAVGIELMPQQLVGVLIDQKGRQLASRQLELESMELDDVVSSAAALAAELTEIIGEKGALGFQLGAPVDTETGIVLFYHKAAPVAPAMPREVYWHGGEPLGPLLEQATSMPVVLENDANAFATYEMWFGAGREASRFAVVLVREGVGGSLVIGNQLFDGPMEIGNLSVFPEKGRPKCDCGNPGCLETTGGTHGILENIAADLRARKLQPPSLENVEAAAELADDADAEVRELAKKAFREAGYAIAKGISFIVNIARPQQVVVYAPSIMVDRSRGAGDAFLSEVDKFGDYCHPVYYDTKLTPKPIESSRGAYGAALVALERHFRITAETTLANLELTR